MIYLLELLDKDLKVIMIIMFMKMNDIMVNFIRGLDVIYNFKKNLIEIIELK